MVESPLKSIQPSKASSGTKASQEVSAVSAMVPDAISNLPVPEVAETRDDVLVSVQTFVNPRRDLRSAQLLSMHLQCRRPARSMLRQAQWATRTGHPANRLRSLTMRSFGNFLHTLLMPSGEAICTCQWRTVPLSALTRFKKMILSSLTPCDISTSMALMQDPPVAAFSWML